MRTRLSRILSILLILLVIALTLLIAGLFVHTVFPRFQELTSRFLKNTSTPTPTAGPRYYVSPFGSNTNHGSRTQPFATIERALSVATPGTTVHVLPGKYYSSDTLVNERSGTATKRITLISDVKWGAKIQTTGARESLLNLGDYVDIIGFDITGDGKIGIDNEGSHTRIIGNRVHDIPATPCDSGGGAGIDDANFTAHDDDIIGNVIHNIGTGSCIFVHGIYHSNLRGHIYNNISYDNSGFGIHLWHAATATIVSNNLVFQNRRGGISIGAGGAPGGVTDDNTVVANNIVIYNHSNAGIRETGQTGTHNLYLNNLVYGNPSGAFSLQNGNVDRGTLIVNPQFVDYQANGSGDYHLQSTSPAIDAGIRIYAPPTDIDGISRLQGKGVDIGPYQALP